MPISTSAMAAGPSVPIWGRGQRSPLPSVAPAVSCASGRVRRGCERGDGGGLRRRSCGSRRHHRQLRGSRARGGGRDRQRLRRRRADPSLRRRRPRARPLARRRLGRADGRGPQRGGHRRVGRRVHRLRQRPLAPPAPRRPRGDREARLRAPAGTCSRGWARPSTRRCHRTSVAWRAARSPKPRRMWRSPAGVCSHHDLTHSLLGMEVGDAVLAVTVVGLEALETDVGPAAHRRLPPRRRRHPARRAPRPGPAPRGTRGRRLRRAPPGRRRPRGRRRVVAPHRRAAHARRCRAR